MVIAEGYDMRIGICDIEAMRELFDVGVYNPDTGVWDEFEISAFKNDLYSFVKFYTANKFDYWVSFNGIGYDHQVLQFVIENYENWYDLSGLEICRLISDFSNTTIENSNKYNIQPPYTEKHFPVKVIDLFRIHHFDNEARRTSLKWCEFMLDMDVEEMPIHFLQENLTEEDVKLTRLYRKNDVMATLGLLYVTLGDVNSAEKLVKEITGIEVKLEALKDYRGKNKIQDRFDVQKETGLECLNWSDVKIGEEWNKNDYKKAEGVKNDFDLISKKIVQPYGKKFKKYFPKTMEFQTEDLKKFINDLGEKYVLAEKQEFKIVIGSTEYTIAKGGIHSTEKSRKLTVPKGWKLRDADVGSQYPNSILKLEIFPPHLKRTIIDQFHGKVEKRIDYKSRGNYLIEQGKDTDARPLMSVQEMLKLCMNGGYYGKLNQPGSFLEYPEGYLKVCMGNQIEILMLIEAMELAGFKVVSGNTDGIVVMFPEEKEHEYKQICTEWEEKVGNYKLGKLEYTDFEAMWQENINHYIGKKTNGKVKKKGRFMTEFELNKNKSKRVVAMALEQYFIHGKNPIDFITNHKNIFDFCIAKKAAGQLHYEELIDDKTTKVHKKLIRYFVSNDGNVFMKRGINNEGNPMNNHVEAMDKDFPWMGQPKLKYFNRAYNVKKFSDYNINYEYYILDCLKRIDAIEKTKKAKQYADQFKKQQMSLF